MGLSADDKLVVVTAGGGGDGYVVMDNFLKLLESENQELPFKTVFITGPFMPKDQRDHITDRARRIGVRALAFLPPHGRNSGCRRCGGQHGRV